MANLMVGIISLTIGVIVLGNVFIPTIKNDINLSGFTGAENAMWGLITLLGIVGLVYGILAVFGLA